MSISYNNKWSDIFNRCAAGDKTALRDMTLCDRFEYAAWAAQETGGRLGVLTSLGAQAIVNLHAVRAAQADIPVAFIDTGFQHPETLAYRDDLVGAGYPVQTVQPLPDNALRAQELVDRYRPVWEKVARDDWMLDASDAFDALAGLVKREPHARVQKDMGVSVWATGRRRDQTASRAVLPVFAFDAQGILTEFNPLADMTSKDIYQYQKAHDLLDLQHPLVKQGASAIGYAWEDPYAAKGECGMHAQTPQTGQIVDVVGKPLLRHA